MKGERRWIIWGVALLLSLSWVASAMAVIGTELGELEIESQEKTLAVWCGPDTCLGLEESSGYYLVVHLSAHVSDRWATVFPTDFSLRTQTREGKENWLDCKGVGRFIGSTFTSAPGLPLILDLGAVRFSLIFYVPPGHAPVELVRISTGSSSPVCRDLRVRMARELP